MVQPVKNKSSLRREALKKRIMEVVNEILYSSDVNGNQITVAEVAKRVPCSRVAVYNNNMDSVIRLAKEKKITALDDSNKLMRARKPKLIKMKDQIQELKEELNKEKLRREKVEQMFYRLVINVMINSNKLNIKKDIDDLLSTPVEPLAFKRSLPFAQRKKDDYLERLMKISSLTRQNSKESS